MLPHLPGTFPLFRDEGIPIPQGWADIQHVLAATVVGGHGHTGGPVGAMPPVVLPANEQIAADAFVRREYVRNGNVHKRFAEGSTGSAYDQPCPIHFEAYVNPVFGRITSAEELLALLSAFGIEGAVTNATDSIGTPKEGNNIRVNLNGSAHIHLTSQVNAEDEDTRIPAGLWLSEDDPKAASATRGERLKAWWVVPTLWVVSFSMKLHCEEGYDIPGTFGTMWVSGNPGPVGIGVRLLRTIFSYYAADQVPGLRAARLAGANIRSSEADRAYSKYIYDCVPRETAPEKMVLQREVLEAYCAPSLSSGGAAYAARVATLVPAPSTQP